MTQRLRQSMKPAPADALGTPGSRDSLNWKMLKESFLVRYKTPKKKKGVYWYVLRQDTFMPKSGVRKARLERYTGKTMCDFISLDDARIVPLAKPRHSFQITVGKKAYILQPESVSSEDCAEWVAALQISVSEKVSFKDVHESTKLARKASTIQQSKSQMEDLEENTALAQLRGEASNETATASTETAEDPSTGEDADDSQRGPSSKLSEGSSLGAITEDVDAERGDHSESDDSSASPSDEEGDSDDDDDDDIFDDYGDDEALNFTERPNRVLTAAGKEVYVTCLQQRLEDISQSFHVRYWQVVSDAREKVLKNVKLLTALSKGRFVPDKHSFYPSIDTLFLSSTFFDTQSERNVLLQFAFPVIARWAASFGVSFSMMDLRWGLHHGTSTSSTVKACLAEVRRAVQSPRPSMAVFAFLTDRRGFIPLPETVSEADFTSLSCSTTNLNDFYQLDANSSPSVYRRTKKRPTKAERRAIRTAMRKLPLNSVTEMEIRAGLDAANIPLRQIAIAERSLMFADPRDTAASTYFDIPKRVRRAVRNLKRGGSNAKRVEEDVDEQSSSSGSDISDGEGEGNDGNDSSLVTKSLEHPTYSADMMQTIKELELPIKHYKVMWQADLKKDSAFIDYLTEFTVQFTRAVISRLGNTFKHDLAITLPPWCREAVAHLKHAHELSKDTMMMTEPLSMLTEHVLGDDKLPFVVTGESGMGKSTLLGQLTCQLARREAKDVAVIARFAGQTSKAASLTHTLCELCKQILYLTDPDSDLSTVPKKFTSLSAAFPQYIANLAKTQQRVVIIIDSLDEYVDDDTRLDERVGLRAWLPTSLPANIKLIVSVRTGDEAQKQLSAIVENPPSLSLAEMSQADANEVFSLHLRKYRSDLHAIARPAVDGSECAADKGGEQEAVALSQSQQQLVETTLAEGCSPLFASLFADMVATWTSFTDAEEATKAAFAADIEDLFRHKLEAVEDMLGQTFVSRALGCISASRDGLTAQELRIILTRDEDVMASICEHHELPDAKFPIHLITLLRTALNNQLAGINNEAITWSHHKFHVAATHRYLGDDGARTLLQANAARALLDDAKLNYLRIDALMPIPVPNLDLSTASDAGQISHSISASIERLAIILPWLFKQAGDKEGLRETLSVPEIFMHLEDLLYVDVSYDLSIYWLYLGDSPEHIVDCFRGMLNLDTLTKEKAKFLHAGLASYLYSASHYTATLEVLEYCAQWRRKHCGESEDTAITINFQGMCALQMGLRDKAIELFEESLAIRLKVFSGDDASAIAASYNNIAIIHKREGRYEQALETYKKAIEMQERLNPSEGNMELLQILNNVAAVHSMMGNYGEAYTLYSDVCDRRRKFLGPSTPLTTCLFNLALVAFRQEKYDLALDHIQESLELRLQLLGPVHQSTAGAMSLKAHILLKCGHATEARDMFLRVLHIRQQGKNDSSLAMTYADVCRASTALASFEEAHKYLDLASALKNDDPHDLRNADITEAAGELAVAEEKYQEALTLFAECIDLYKQLYDDSHPQVQRIHLKIKDATDKMGQAASEPTESSDA